MLRQPPDMSNDIAELIEPLENEESTVNQSKKMIKIENATQLLGAIYNCILSNDTGYEGMVKTF